MMIQESLAEQISSHSLNTQPIIQSCFILIMDGIQRDQCIVQLFQDYIIIIAQTQQKPTFLKVQMNFDLIFGLLRQQEVSENGSKKNTGLAFGIKLQRFQHSLQLISQHRNQEQLFYWRDLLQTKLNQRGFHQIFKPIKKIGKGNFGTVYLVKKNQNGKNYAVKAFSKQVAYGEEKGKESIVNQIEIMRNLNHPNLMKLYEIYQSENSIYFVVQLLQGGQLYDKVKQKYSFKKDEVLTVMRSLLEGIETMHAQNIMHRDLKPENIIFRNEGDFECVVADFGLATFADAKDYLFIRCGTPGYVAPQVVNLKDLKAKYDPICDMFSAGVIFHLLSMKKSPFPGKQYNQVLTQNRVCNIDFSKDQYKKIPEQWLDLMMRMLEKNPQKRITASEALSHPAFNVTGRQKVRKDSICTDCKQNIEQEMKPFYRDSPKKTSMICQSPLMTTKNNERKKGLLKDDSCLKFKMKQNIMTGKVEEGGQSIDEINSPANAKKKPKKEANQSRFKGKPATN